MARTEKKVLSKKAVPTGKYRTAATSPQQESQMESSPPVSEVSDAQHHETHPAASSKTKPSTSTTPRKSTSGKIGRITSAVKGAKADKPTRDELIKARSELKVKSWVAMSERHQKREPRKKHRKRDYTHFGLYLHTVLKEVHPQLNISTNAMSIMNSLMHDMFNRLAVEASRLCVINKSRTLTSRDIQTAVRLLLPGELATHAVSDGTKAVTRYITDRQRQQRRK